MRERKLYLLFFILFNFLADDALGCDLLFYGAKEIANGVAYKAALHFGGCGEVNSGTSQLQISLLNGDSQLLSSSISALVGQWTEFELAVPDDACTVGKELTIQISSGDKPYLSQSVKCSDSANVLIVQMNKPLYKPGDAIKVQIFCVVRENTGTCENIEVEVYVTNPQGTMMNVETHTFGSGNGEEMIVEYTYRVATKPVLGEYCVVIQPLSSQVSLKTVKKCVDIEEYVLPTFEGKVIFDQGAFVINNPVTITGKVEATYTYGQPVLTAHYVLTCWIGDESNGEKLLDLTISEDDIKTFTLNSDDLLEAVESFKSRNWNQDAVITCNLDAKESDGANLPVQSSQASLSVKEHQLSVDCCDSFSCPDIVRPGSHHICLKVTNADGSNVGNPMDASLSLKVTFSQCQRDDQVVEKTDVTIGERLEFTFNVQEKSDAKYEWGGYVCNTGQVYSLEAAVYEKSSRDAKSLVYNPDLSEFNSDIQSYLSVDVCNSEATFQVNSQACVKVDLVQKTGNTDVISLIVMVKSRGIVRDVFLQSVSSFPVEIQITIDAEMTPNFVVFVSAMGAASSTAVEKEALPASITIPVDQSSALLPNQVSLQPGPPPGNKGFYPPGYTVPLQVTTSAADSVVALIGIDKQMIAAAGKANIIQVDDVVEALASSGGSDEEDDDDIMPFFWFSWPSRSSDAQSTIKDAGFVYAVSGNYRVPGSPDDFYGVRYKVALRLPVLMHRETNRVVPIVADSLEPSVIGSISMPHKAKVRKSFREVTVFRVVER